MPSAKPARNDRARQIAIVDDHAGLMAALQARADELRKNPVKFLAPVHIPRLNRLTLGPLLTCLGVVLEVVEHPDPAVLKRINRYEKRSRPLPKNASDMLATRSREKGADWARLMNRRRSLKLDASKRSAIARIAAQARWRNEDHV